MDWPVLITAVACVCGLSLALRMMAAARTPPGADAAAILGLAALGALGMSLLTIWLRWS